MKYIIFLAAIYQISNAYVLYLDPQSVHYEYSKSKVVYPTLLDNAWRPNNYKRINHPLDDIVDKIDGSNIDFLDVHKDVQKHDHSYAVHEVAVPVVVAESVTSAKPKNIQSEPEAIAASEVLQPVKLEKESTSQAANGEAASETNGEIFIEEPKLGSSEKLPSREEKVEVITEPKPGVTENKKDDVEVVTQIIKIEPLPTHSEAVTISDQGEKNIMPSEPFSVTSESNLADGGSGEQSEAVASGGTEIPPKEGQ